ncbi:unnamed protein product [Tilletia controversa]|nr:unnamed protein product [Tilletia controversa]
MRRKYYSLPVGSRLDMTFIHQAVLDPIPARLTTRLAVQEILASLKSSTASSSSSAATPSSTAAKGKSSGSKPAASATPKPFRQGDESRPTRLGACIVCGAKEYNHAFESCSKRADGKPAFAARDERNHLIRTSDCSPICRFYNLSIGCKLSATASCYRGDHICSLCGSSAHNAQACGGESKSA